VQAHSGARGELIFAGTVRERASSGRITIAFRIPNLLRDLFAEGALSTSFITTFSKTIAPTAIAPPGQLANKVATLTVIVLSSITIAGIITAPWLCMCSHRDSMATSSSHDHPDANHVFPHRAGSLAALVMGI